MFARTTFTTQHHDDQRDVAAYVLGVSGFPEEAALVRSLGRVMSYWSLADLLTERWLQARDADLARRGVTVLQRLLEYASIAETSRWLIQVDIARLAAAGGDMEMARKTLQESMKHEHKVIQHRAAHDASLAKLVDLEPRRL